MLNVWILTIACVILIPRSAPAELAGPSVASASEKLAVAEPLTKLAAHRHYQHYPSNTSRYYAPYQNRAPYGPTLRVLPQHRRWYGFGYEYGIPQGRSYWNYGW